MILSQEELKLIEKSRMIARKCVDLSNMVSLNEVVKIVIEAKINILLLFMSDTEFQDRVKEGSV